LNLGGELSRIADQAQTTQFTNLAPGLAILSSRHETQYSRLFRS